MIKTTLKNVPTLVNSLTEFNCNGTLFSRKYSDSYFVFSYGEHFPVAIYKNNEWLVNKDKYSVTTSKHQGKVKAGLFGAQRELSTYELRAFV